MHTENKYPSRYFVTESNVGDFMYGGGVYSRAIKFPHPIGTSNISVAVQSMDGKHIAKSTTVFVDIQEDVYYVDLDVEYEDTVGSITNTSYFYDNFETDTFNSGWSTIFKANTQIRKMWGNDYVAEPLSNVERTLLGTVDVPVGYTVEWLFVRDDKSSDATIRFVGDRQLEITWSYINKAVSIDIDNARYTTVNHPSNASQDLRCDGSIKSIAFKLTNTTLYIKFNNVGDWVSVATFVSLGDLTDMTLQAQTGVGFGYFYADAVSGLPDTYGSSQDHPLTYTQFKNRVNNNISVNAYDKYKCKGYRQVPDRDFFDVQVPITIEGWGDLGSTWCLAFNPYGTSGIAQDFSLAMLRNGVIYNMKKSGRLLLVNTLDMFIVWNMSVGTKRVYQHPLKWKSSPYYVSNLVGTTIKIVDS
jgi:hypothetical protein